VVLIFLAMRLGAEEGAAPSRETLTLPVSVERALSNNPRLLMARKDLEVARTHVREAQSLFYPKLNLSLNYIRYKDDTLAVTSNELGAAVLEPHTDPANLYLGRLGFKQTLYSGGRLNTTYKLSKASMKSAESSYETLRREVEFDTTQSFLELLAHVYDFHFR